MFIEDLELILLKMSLSKKRSAVWEFFKQVDNEGKKIVVSELCKASLAYCGGTTTMKTHLTHKHPSILLGKDEGAVKYEKFCSWIQT